MSDASSGAKSPDSRFGVSRTIAFSETDAAGIVHFSNFFRFMEDAEHAYLRSIGFEVHHDDADSIRGFVRVGATADYRHPLKFADEIRIRVDVVELREKSVRYRFTFERADLPEPAANGALTVVYAVKPRGAARFKAAAIPTELANRLRQDLLPSADVSAAAKHAD